MNLAMGNKNVIVGLLVIKEQISTARMPAWFRVKCTEEVCRYGNKTQTTNTNDTRA
jgi:hypothetical protein